MYFLDHHNIILRNAVLITSTECGQVSGRFMVVFVANPPICMSLKTYNLIDLCRLAFNILYPFVKVIR